MNIEEGFSRAWKHYGLRTCKHDGSSHRGFVWPLAGLVECPDWSPVPKCGKGLHALLNGEGNANLLGVESDRWQVVGFDEYVDLEGKVKFPRCEVVTPASCLEAANMVKRLTGGAVHYCAAVAGDWGAAVAGYRGKAIAGNYGTAVAGHRGAATAGDWGTAIAGNRGTATAGDYGTLIILFWKNNRRCYAVAYTGEDGIKPGVAYKLDDNHQFTEA